MSKSNYEPKWMKARSTSQARRAIAEFINDNADNLSEWLERVAYGIPKVDEDGSIIRDSDGSVVYLLKPDPNAAIKAVADIAEYHLPKLSRSEATVVAQVENLHNADLRTLTNEQINHRILELIGFNFNGDVLDAEAVEVSEPNK